MLLGIDVSTLSAQDLNKLRTSLSEDVQLITNNYGNLKVAQSRYTQALDALQDLKPENQGIQIHTHNNTNIGINSCVRSLLNNVCYLCYDICSPCCHNFHCFFIFIFNFFVLPICYVILFFLSFFLSC